MKRIALVANNTVENIIMVSDRFESPDGVLAIETESANIGDAYDGVDFIPAKREFSKDEMVAIAIGYHKGAMSAGAEVNIDGEVIKIPVNIDTYMDVVALASVADSRDTDLTLVIPNKILKLSKLKIKEVHDAIVHHVVNCQDTLGRTIEGIINGDIASIGEIDDSWRSAYAK